MKTTYYLLTEEGIHKITKCPFKMMKVIGINALPHVYKQHYFKLVYETTITELKNTGMIEGDTISHRKLEGATRLKNIMEDTIIKSLGEDVLDTFKDELEKGWKEMFNEIDNSISEEVKDDADKLIANHGYTVEDDNIPKLMFP